VAATVGAVAMGDAWLLDAVYDLSPQEFEHQVARLLVAEGYRNVRVQGGADDRGIDIVCHDAEGQLVAVQCKRFAPTTTINAMVVQHLVGMALKRKAHRAMLVTTGGFTKPARVQAEEFDVELIDGPTLASLIASHSHLVAALGEEQDEEEEDTVPGGSVPTSVLPRATFLILVEVILRDIVRPTPKKLAILITVALLWWFFFRP
jgi:Restriction endonuclease